MEGAADVVGLLRTLVQHRSEDPPGRELELAELVRDQLQACGVSASVDEFSPGRANVLGRVRGRGRAGSLVFSAHLDTMPAAEHGWTHPPFVGEIASGRVYGRGAADMKGALAAMIVAAGHLARGAEPPPGDVVLAFSAGESSSCIGAKRFIEAGALSGVDAILVGEPSGMRVLTAEKGALWLRLEASGRAGHSSGADGAAGTGDNAADRLVDALLGLREAKLPGPAHQLLGPTTCSVGTLSAGRAVNLTPDRASAEIDLRHPPGVGRAALVEAIAAAVGPEIVIHVIDHKPAVTTPADHPFVAACLAAVAERCGIDEPPGGVSYFSDSNVLCPALGVSRVIVGPGAIGMSGQPDEHVEVANLRAAVDVYASVARQWVG